MPYHKADRNHIYGKCTDDLLDLFYKGLRKAGMNHWDADECVREIKKESESYDETFERVIGYL